MDQKEKKWNSLKKTHTEVKMRSGCLETIIFFEI